MNNIVIDDKRLLEVAKKYGIKVKKVPDGEGGIVNKDGSITPILFEDVFPYFVCGHQEIDAEFCTRHKCPRIKECKGDDKNNY